MIEAKPNQQKNDFNQDEYIMIRGYPRARQNVEYVEQMMSGKLVGDNEASLMLQLDQYLFRAKKELGHYPDMLELPSEPFARFVPVPFDINFFGAIMKSYRKPAWFRIPKTINIQTPWGRSV